ncbi:MAG: AAA family ATPase, partial [Candidatus Micrarchaeota archaeon]|nr:AAA family ATPase [Candidatus Micrarchaeota archaeon]
MRHFADLHFHSKYSRAVSPDMSLDGLNAGAKRKGLTILGTGDFTHPLWFSELKKRLAPDDSAPGFFRLDAGDNPDSVRFMLTCEVSTLCSTPNGAKKVHHLLHVPDVEQVEQINDVLSKKGNLSAAGRPMFGKTMPAE